MPVTVSGSGPVAGVTSLNTTVSDVELGFLDGVTSAIQTQINTAGGLVKITDSTFSAVSSVSVNNCFSSTYDNYRILLDLSAATGTNALPSFRLRVSGSDSATSYSQRRFLTNGTTGLNNTDPDGTTQWGLGYVSSGNVENQSCSIEVYKPFLTRPTTSQINVYQGQGDYAGFAYGFHSASTSYTGFSLLISTGNITGTVRVYGYRN
jgi:hypothetical protein